MQRPPFARHVRVSFVIALVLPAVLAQDAAGPRAPRPQPDPTRDPLLTPFSAGAAQAGAPSAPALSPEDACRCAACDHTDCSCGCSESSTGASSLPPGFYDQIVASGFDQATGFLFAPGNLVYIWEKGGVVRVLEPDTTLNPVPLLDLSEEVGNWGDHGLLGAVLDPDFGSNGWIYLLYAVDHHHAKFFGTPSYDPEVSEPFVDTIGRITRYTANASDGFRTVDPQSRLVLLGESITTGVPLVGITHGVGSLQFGDDGSLLASTGDCGGGNVAGTALQDGIAQVKELVGSFRSQLVDCLSGKILRIDPATGDGLPGNPWYDAAAPRAPRSRVFMLGLRQPCRFALRKGTGSVRQSEGRPGLLAIGDVGGSEYEELTLSDEAGANFGWPIYEGLGTDPTFGGADPDKQNFDAPNPLFPSATCNKPYFLFTDLIVGDSLLPPFWKNPCDASVSITTVPTFMHRRPVIDWLHDVGLARVPTYDAGGAAAVVALGDPASPVAGEPFGGSCSIGGCWYDGSSFPPDYQGTLFQADYGLGWIRNFLFDAEFDLVEVRPFANLAGKPVRVEMNPVDGSLWYLDFTDTGEARLRAIRYDPNNLPPVAVASVAPGFGATPLLATFDSTGSSDPEGQPLTLRWDFSDGTPYSIFPQTVRDLPSEDITDAGEFALKVLLMDPPGSTGFSNHDLEVMRDGVRPLLDSLDPLLQYDTLHFVDGVSDKAGADWFGYSFAENRTFTGFLFQEGLNYLGGGYFDTLNVQVRINNVWTNVSGITIEPPYPGDLSVGFETFEIHVPSVTGNGIRLHGLPGGIGDYNFTTIAEARVLARPLDPEAGPQAVDGTLHVFDPASAESTATVKVVLDDTPPVLHITEPKTGFVYSTSVTTPVDCSVSFKDTETHDPMLEVQWQVILHHDEHTHPQPVVTEVDPTLLLIAEGGCNGDLYYQEIRCTVTDPSGLFVASSVYTVPDCDLNLNAIDDRDDIIAGTSRDMNENGVPDEVEVDCNGNGVSDLYDVFFGSSPDEDGDGVPDECTNFSFGKQQAPTVPGPVPPY